MSEYLPELQGKRVAVFSNQSGIVGDKVRGSRLADALSRYNGCFLESGNPAALEAASTIPFLEPSVPGGRIEYGPHLVDVLLEKGVDVKAIFSPEHGFRGDADAGEHVQSSVDEKTGVEILSLYGHDSRKPDKERMDKFDVLVIDIQDVGLRFYTYYITMYHLMEACAESGKKVILLDRPNPNGFYVDGPVLDMEFKSGIGWIPISVVHGLTLGEMARMINGEGWLKDGVVCDLKVVPCLHYTHATRYSLILPPSPNLKDMKSIYLYSSTCSFEGTVLSVGRGTQWPFEVFGHPDIKSGTFTFTPRSLPGAKKPVYLDETCHGWDLRGKPLEEIWACRIDLSYLVKAFEDLRKGESFFGTNNHFDLLFGTDQVRRRVLDGFSASEISASWEADVEAFMKKREKYLLYE